MSAKEKPSREPLPEQEAPLERGFIERFESEVGTHSRVLFEKLVAHWRKVAGAAVVFVILVTGYAGFNVYQERQLANSEQALGRVLLEAEGPDRLAELLQLSGLIAKPLLPRYHLEAAKAAQDIGDWATALEFWRLLDEAGLEHWTSLARMGQATALLHLNQAELAVEELTSLRPGVSRELLPLVLLQLAGAAEAAGKWDLALQTYSELKTFEDGRQAEFLSFKTAQIRQRMAEESL